MKYFIHHDCVACNGGQVSIEEVNEAYFNFTVAKRHKGGFGGEPDVRIEDGDKHLHVPSTSYCPECDEVENY